MFASATRRSILVLASALAMAMPVAARSTTPEVVALGSLPVAARLTDRRIRAGGPFPYAKDGTVFGNRERLLPREARGYYREYTVPTPGARDRGARRIVCGGDRPATPQACWYTADHYTSFKRIVH
jgi:ribonuclease T1